ncbi:MAG: glycosyltransferase [Eubacterium sp.]|nr:glycosyltransferase [Eubacterium sp.]
MKNKQNNTKKLSISIIIPLYNCESFIRHCVESILNMNRDDVEIILINDGSTDETGEICECLAKSNEFIHYFLQENQGVSAARNNGLSKAQGEYVLFIDADDIIDPEAMNLLLTKITDDSSIDMAIYGMTFDYYHHGECYRRETLNTPIKGSEETSEWIKKIEALFDANSLSSLCNKVFKRSLLEKNQLELNKEMFLYEDLEYSIRCLTYCNHIFFEPTAIYHYRQSEDEGNAGRRLKRIEHINGLVDQIEKAFELLQKNCLDIYDIEIEKKNILLKLYLVLAREKIEVSGRKEVKIICEDFKRWSIEHQMISDDNYFMMLMNQNVSRLILKRNYSSLRHKIAVKVKNTGWYQKKHS